MAARLRALGLAPLLASVRGIGLSVMDLAQQKPGALDKAATRRASRSTQDGADVLVLGCMSMAFLPGICEDLGARVGVPVVNPVVAALKTAETVARHAALHTARSRGPVRSRRRSSEVESLKIADGGR